MLRRVGNPGREESSQAFDGFTWQNIAEGDAPTIPGYFKADQMFTSKSTLETVRLRENRKVEN